jgi:hypothetical protein
MALIVGMPEMRMRFVRIVETDINLRHLIDKGAKMSQEKIDVIVACRNDDFAGGLDIASSSRREPVGRIARDFITAKGIVETVERASSFRHHDDVVPPISLSRLAMEEPKRPQPMTTYFVLHNQLFNYTLRVQRGQFTLKLSSVRTTSTSGYLSVNSRYLAFVNFFLKTFPADFGIGSRHQSI